MSTVDPQDPLPEVKFIWRRIFTFVVTAILLALLAAIVLALREALAADQLADVAFWLICLIAWMVTTYMLAPSGEQVAKMIQAGRIAVVKETHRAAPPQSPDAEIDFDERNGS